MNEGRAKESKGMSEGKRRGTYRHNGGWRIED
jgi:hypothetical protein